MDRLGIWFRGTFDHLKAHWQAHLVPALAYFGVIFGGTMVLVVVGMAIAVAAAISEVEWLLAVGGGVFLLGFFAMMLAAMPLTHGYYRGVLSLMRGGTLSVADVFGGFRDFLPVTFAMVIVMSLVCTGALFCYVPGILAGILLQFTLPVMADRGVGPVEAVKQSVALARRRFGALLLLWLALLVVGTIVSYIPIVGPLASIPLWTVAILTAYEDLRKEAGIEPGPPPEQAT